MSNVDLGVEPFDLVRDAWKRRWTLKTSWFTATPIPSDLPETRATWTYTDDTGEYIRGNEDIRERMYWHGGTGVDGVTVVKPEVTR